jgi:von Willebrand factor type A domain
MNTTRPRLWMKVILWLVILFNGEMLLAQFPEAIHVPSTGKPVQSSILKPGVRYKVTVSGTYSMWQGFDSIGVDAQYIYDVPTSEISALRWPEEEYIIYPLDTVKALPLPHWVGSTEIFPPNNPIISILFPLYKFDFRNHMGFRIDGSPMSRLPQNPTNNVYSYVTLGLGKVLTFQILDSVISVVSGRTLPAYLDNSGTLKVVIEETGPDSIYIDECADHVVTKDSAGKMTGVKINIALLKNAFDPNSKPINLLNEVEPSKIGLYENGKFYCPDSIVCRSETPGSLGVAMVFDRSGSMLFEIDPTVSSVVRAEAAREAGITFVNKFNPDDKISIYSFGTNVTQDKIWGGKNQAPTALNTINSIYPAGVGGRTAFYRALIQAIQGVNSQNTTKKAIIALTDGVNNEDPLSVNAVLNALPKGGSIPIYIIALGLNAQEPGIPEALNNMKKIADSSNGKFFTIKDSAELVAVYDQLSVEVKSEECCTVYYSVPPCDSNKNDTVRKATIYYMDNGSIKTKEITYTTPCKKLFAGKRMIDLDPTARKTKQPIRIMNISNAKQFEMQIPQHVQGTITIELYDSNGKMIGEIYSKKHKAGKHEIPLTIKGMEKGYYRAVIRVNGEMIQQLPVEVKQ